MLRLGPSPPELRACWAHAWCEYSESVDMAARWGAWSVNCAQDKRRRSRTEHRGVETRKLGERVVEREDFGWTNKGKVARGIKSETSSA
jgi:hypothetical protein